MNKIANMMIALVLAGLMLFSVCSPVFATDGELDRDHHETYDSWLGWCTSYNAALAGNVDVTVVPNTNFACYYSTTAGVAKRPGFVESGIAWYADTRNEKATVEWADIWNEFGTFQLVDERKVLTNVNASNTRPTDPLIAYAWDLLWNLLGEVDPVFSVLPSPTGLVDLSQPNWKIEGEDTTFVKIGFYNNPDEIGIKFTAEFSSVTKEGYFYVWSTHQADSGFNSYSTSTMSAGMASADFSRMRQVTLVCGRKTAETRTRTVNGQTFTVTSYKYEDIDWPVVVAQTKAITEGSANTYVWVPVAQHSIVLLGRTAVYLY